MAFFIFFLPLFILFPTLVGLNRYKTLDEGHKFFFYYLVLTSFFQITNALTIEITIKTKIHYCSYGVSFVLLFQTLHHWARSLRWKKVFKVISVFSPIVIIIELFLRNQVEMLPSYGFLINSFAFCFFALPLLVKNFSHGTKVPWENSIVLILIPLIITLLISFLLHLVYAIVYSSFTHPILSRSFFVLRILQLVSYFSFTIAMLWAPRKEIFI